MSIEIELLLTHIDAIKTNEEQDEIYIEAETVFVGGAGNVTTRFPKGEKSCWKLRYGQSTGPNEILYSGQVDDGLTLKLRVKEEDAGGLISLGDDDIGAMEVRIAPDRTVSWDVGKHTNHLGKESMGELFELSGAKTQYKVSFKLYEKTLL